MPYALEAILVVGVLNRQEILYRTSLGNGLQGVVLQRRGGGLHGLSRDTRHPTVGGSPLFGEHRQHPGNDQHHDGGSL